MSGTPDRYRLAIAALEVPDPLCNALDDLRVYRFSAGDLCLAGTPEAIATMRTTLPVGSDPFLSPLLEVEPVPFMGSGSIVATAARPITTLKKTRMARGRLDGDGGQCWLEDPSRAPLLEHINRGDVLILAGPLDADQLMVGTRVLLRHSERHVQGHGR